VKVATWHGETRFTLDEAPDPGPAPGQAVVAVHTSGICGTDVHTTQGLYQVTPPRVMGHEYAGMVVAVGRGVSRRWLGREVACEPNYGCGDCPECRAGLVSQCARCVRVGGFAERVALPVANLHPLPGGLDLATASLAEPAACCLSGLEMFRMPRGATVVVLGGGIIGLLTLALARDRGAARTILSDPLPGRRDAASRLGADRVVDPTVEDLPAIVREATAGAGADVVCEAVGKPELVRQAIAIVRPRGIVQLVGVSPKGSPVPADLFDVHFRELTIQGAFGRGQAFRRALRALPRLGVADLLTARFALHRVAEAFAHATAGHGLKTVLAPGEA
jgi:L-iditol 2-dehydrogenase